MTGRWWHLTELALRETEVALRDLAMWLLIKIASQQTRREAHERALRQHADDLVGYLRAKLCRSNQMPRARQMFTLAISEVS